MKFTLTRNNLVLFVRLCIATAEHRSKEPKFSEFKTINFFAPNIIADWTPAILGPS